MKNIYVIIVTYNGLKWIDKCLRSVLESDIKLKVILIDNLSSDATLSHVRKNFPTVHTIAVEKNLGFGRANNIGIRIAIEDKADGVFFLNQDAYVETSTISKLVETCSLHPQIGIASPLHFNGVGSSFDIGFANCYNTSEKVVLLNSLGRTETVFDVSFVNAAAWYVPKKALQEVGCFDPIYVHYGEDADYCNRVRFFNYKIIISGEVKVYHDRLQVPIDDVRNNIVKYSHGTYVNYLSLAKKPGDSNVLSLIKIFLYTCLNVFKEISILNLRTCKVHLTHFVSIIRNFKTIIKHKIVTQKPGAYV